MAGVLLVQSPTKTKCISAIDLTSFNIANKKIKNFLHN